MNGTRFRNPRVLPQVVGAAHLRSSLGPETIAEGARRLGKLGLVYSVGCLVMGRFGRFAESAFTGGGIALPDVLGLAAIAMGLAVYAVVRMGVLPAKRLLDLGLVFWVAGALGIAAREFWYGLPLAPSGWFVPIPAECIWLILYPLVVPNTPKKILIASLLAASMGPVGLAMSAASTTGTPVGRPIDAATYFLTSNYICAILAYVNASIVQQFSRRLEDARSAATS